MTNAEARIRSFIERIIRLKEEQDALTDDIREIYKEAAGEGFNKTALGNVVTLVRKRAKDGEKLAALEADVALYLAAYDGAGKPIDNPTDNRHARAHTHAPATPHDSDGVVIEPAATPIPSAPSHGLNGGQPQPPSSDAVPAADGSPRADLVGEFEQAPEPIPVQSHIVHAGPIEVPDVPDFLIRDKATNRAPWMDREAGE